MKKKIVAMMLASMMAFNLIGCGEPPKESNAPEEKQESIENEEDSDKKEEIKESAEDLEKQEAEDLEKEEAKEGNFSEYVGKPLSELMNKVNELGYTATYLADGVDFTGFIDAMKDDYLTGAVKEDTENKTVEVTLKLISNAEAENAKVSLNEKFPEGDAWVVAENYGQEQFGAGFDLNFLIGKIDASAEDENTWFLKAECTLDGTDMICEAKITGTKDAPTVISFDIY